MPHLIVSYRDSSLGYNGAPLPPNDGSENEFDVEDPIEEDESRSGGR